VPEQRLEVPLSDQAQAAHREALARFRALQDAGFQSPATVPA